MSDTLNSITRFTGPYRFLSNFWPCEIKLDGLTYPSVEHAYQAAKTLDLGERFKILNTPYAGDAKRLGRNVTLREDWDAVRIDIMRELLLQKFSLYPGLRRYLLDTGDIHIEEGNTWGDRFWGTVDGQGENHLGKLLMMVREQIR